MRLLHPLFYNILDYILRDTPYNSSSFTSPSCILNPPESGPGFNDRRLLSFIRIYSTSLFLYCRDSIRNRDMLFPRRLISPQVCRHNAENEIPLCIYIEISSTTMIETQKTAIILYKIRVIWYNDNSHLFFYLSPFRICFESIIACSCFFSAEFPFFYHFLHHANNDSAKEALHRKASFCLPRTISLISVLREITRIKYFTIKMFLPEF